MFYLRIGQYIPFEFNLGLVVERAIEMVHCVTNVVYWPVRAERGRVTGERASE